MHLPVSIIEGFVYVMCSTFSMLMLYNLGLNTFEACLPLRPFPRRKRQRKRKGSVKTVLMNIFNTLL